ncbi:hypothetical protein N7540_011825 [Penicillium herquei]|nr:hypothetical protein N7540_011825 [Penicillium herquei]
MKESLSISCWTCRRRRVRCDRQLPQCHKCFISGNTCQGYSKERPLKWINGVASRGKLMGKALPINDGVTPPIPRLLLDPVLQDLSPKMRHYIKYCGSNFAIYRKNSLLTKTSVDQFCSVESVLYDSPTGNPFREFMRLMPSSQGLLHTIISIAALHQAYREVTHTSVEPHRISFIERDTMAVNLHLMTSSEHLPPAAIYDSLTHKQLALKNIRKELLYLNYSSLDGTIASILLLVWQDLMDSGTNSWKCHLDALKGIVPVGPYTETQNSNSRTIYNNFETTYAAFQILGNTFVKSKELYHPLFSTMPISQILDLSDGQSWAGCPAQLLSIISLLNNASINPTQSSDFIASILLAFQEFAPMKWAIANKSPSVMKPRYHLASAYKGAVAIYMAQVMHGYVETHAIELPHVDPLDSLIVHLLSIDFEDDHFKSLVWPSFVIGAEAKEESQRRSITQIFESLWRTWRCENVRNALKVLLYLWELRDQRKSSGHWQWINELYGWGMNWIFI